MSVAFPHGTVAQPVPPQTCWRIVKRHSTANFAPAKNCLRPCADLGLEGHRVQASHISLSVGTVEKLD
jgi:hypothetical protein